MQNTELPKVWTVTCRTFHALPPEGGRFTLKLEGCPGGMLEVQLDKKTLAAQLSRKPRSVQSWLVRGCPHSRLDGSIRFRQSEVEDWLRREALRRFIQRDRAKGLLRRPRAKRNK